MPHTRSGVFIVNFEHVFLSLILSRLMSAGLLLFDHLFQKNITKSFLSFLEKATIFQMHLRYPITVLAIKTDSSIALRTDFILSKSLKLLLNETGPGLILVQPVFFDMQLSLRN